MGEINSTESIHGENGRGIVGGDQKDCVSVNVSETTTSSGASSSTASARQRSSGINDEVVQDSIKELSGLLSKIDDQAFIYDFLQCLLSKPELKAIASRWLIVKEIDSGTTQREIAKKFSMSLCKITRGSKELNKPDSAFRKMLSILKNK